MGGGVDDLLRPLRTFGCGREIGCSCCDAAAGGIVSTSVAGGRRGDD